MVLTMFFVPINKTNVCHGIVFQGVRGAIATNPSSAEFPPGEAIRPMSDNEANLDIEDSKLENYVSREESL